MTPRTASPDLLLRHASGQLRPAAALVVESHLALSPAARGFHGTCQILGGVVLERTAPADLDARLFERVLARLDEPRPALPQRPVARPTTDRLGLRLPEPLRGRRVTGWRWMGPGMSFARIAVPEDPTTNLVLLKIGAGRRMPHHGHSGEELTLVLQGAFEDEGGRYIAGDLAEEDGDTRHTPVVTGHEDCICLAAINGPLRPESWVARLVQPLIGL